jgi:hypothetical protein
LHTTGKKALLSLNTGIRQSFAGGISLFSANSGNENVPADPDLPFLLDSFDGGSIIFVKNVNRSDRRSG